MFFQNYARTDLNSDKRKTHYFAFLKVLLLAGAQCTPTEQSVGHQLDNLRHFMDMARVGLGISQVVATNAPANSALAPKVLPALRF
jgi:hypothetical protein